MAVVDHYKGDHALNYAAGRCSAFSDEGYTDWYLPSVCEMGVGENNASTGCGSAVAPRQQNIFLNLFKNGDPGHMLTSVYWTSTAASGVPAGQAWAQQFTFGGNSSQLRFDRTGTNLLQRCVRAIRP